MSPLTMTGILHALLHLADEGPIGAAVIELAAGAAVDGDHLDAALCSAMRARLRRIAVGVRPSPCASSASPAASRPSPSPRGCGAAWVSSRISDEPAWPLTTFFTGQPKLMSMMRGAAILVELRRLGHHLGLAAGELHGHRKFLGRVLRHQQGLARFADHRLAGDHLGHDQARARLASPDGGTACPSRPTWARG